LFFDMTGETFEFQTSAHRGDGHFRFRWTLAAGKKGPPEHIHDDESETFTVSSGALRVWVNGTPQDLHPGDVLTVQRGQAHRFLNFGSEPAVVDVCLDGPRMEAVLVPMAQHLDGRRRLRLGELGSMIVHDVEVRGSRASSAFAAATLAGLAWLLRLLGVKTFGAPSRW
jgi:quercetin dioxygenase-like cupin family protein